MVVKNAYIKTHIVPSFAGYDLNYQILAQNLQVIRKKKVTDGHLTV